MPVSVIWKSTCSAGFICEYVCMAGLILSSCYCYECPCIVFIFLFSPFKKNTSVSCCLKEWAHSLVLICWDQRFFCLICKNKTKQKPINYVFKKIKNHFIVNTEKDKLCLSKSDTYWATIVGWNNTECYYWCTAVSRMIHS